MRFRSAWIVVVTLALVATGCDWAQLGDGPTHTGFNADTGITTTNVATLHQVWSSPGQANTTTTGSQIVVADGKVFAREGLSGLRTLDEATGAVDWLAGYGGVAAVANHLMYAELFPGPGRIQATLDARNEDGSIAWSDVMTIDSYLFPGDAVVANGQLFLTWSFPAAIAGLQRYDASTGATDTTTGTFGTTGTVNTPVVAGGVVYATTTDGILHALSATDFRQEEWEANVPAGGVPSIDSGRVYITSGSSVMAFDAAGQTNCAPSGGKTVCTPLWTSTTSDTLSQQAPAVGSGIVAVRSDRHLFALDPSTGAARWSAVVGATAQAPQGLGSPSIENGVVFVGSLDGALEAFDAAGSTSCSGAPTVCTPLKSVPLVGPTGASQPAIANGNVYIGAFDAAHQKPVAYKLAL
jgi:outer membrane protein assembly factor BamB